jgi:hypothetical protein
MGIERRYECVVRVGVEHATWVVSLCVIFGVDPVCSPLVQGFFFLLQMLTVSLHTEVSCAPYVFRNHVAYLTKVPRRLAILRPSTQCDLPTLPLSRVSSPPLVPTLTQSTVYVPQPFHYFPSPSLHYPALHLETPSALVSSME